MKITKYIIMGSLLLAMAAGCDKGIDPITPVAPGADTTAPSITVTFPTDNAFIRVPDEIATINIQAKVSDDIEIQKITFYIDGTEITSYSSFTDYRNAILDYSYNHVTDGEHVLKVVATDVSGKSSTTEVHFSKVPPYVPMDGEVFYMPFEGEYTDLVTFAAATKAGSPTFADGKVGKAMVGAADSYITFPAAAFMKDEFSVSFWYKMKQTPARAGIFAISPPGDSRNSGFRFARENNGDNQNLFINLGIGASEVWINPFYITANTDWMHIAVSVSSTAVTVYVNKEVVKETPITAHIDWTDCTTMSFGSGMPNFGYWEHFSDFSMFDELRIFNKAITAAEVNTIYTAK